MKWRRIARAARWLLPVVAAELLYVLVANAILFSGAIQRAASARPERIDMAWDRAYSPWPGRVYLSGFRLRLQDSLIQFRLTIDSATVDVVLWDLLHKKFGASHVQAEGVSYRMLGKVETAAGREKRLAAFPPLEGYSRPALQANPPPTPLTSAEREALWTVELDDVSATISELWFVEYRYHGPARVNGAFELSPLRRLRVGPAVLLLDGGELSAGDHVISSALTARVTVTIDPVDLPSSPGLRVLHTLTTSIHFDTPIEDLGVADLYLDSLRAHGAGRLTADLQVAGGRLLPGSSLEAWLPGADAQVEGLRLTADAHGKLSVSEDANVPTVHATLSGALRVPLLGKEAVAALSDVTATVVLVDNDVSRGLSLQRLHAVLGEARVRDARAVTAAVGSVVPLVAPAVLGDGPLVASATSYVTPEYTLVRLKSLQQGGAELQGAVVSSANGWNGAAFGHFGVIPLGLRVKNSKFQSALFVAQPWLGDELLKAGIKPEEPALSRADSRR
jgi:hypothetical protein